MILWYIITKLKDSSPNTQIYMQSILPIGEDKANNPTNILNIITELNHILKEISSKHEIIEYIEIGDLLKDEQEFLKKIYTEDDIHLNGVAYQIWNDSLENYLF